MRKPQAHKAGNTHFPHKPIQLGMTTTVFFFALLFSGTAIPPHAHAYDLRDNAIEHARQSQLYTTLDRPNISIEELKVAIKLNRHTTLSAALYNNLGIAYRTTKQYPYAIASFQRACRLNPKYALYFKNLVETYALSGVLSKVEARLLEELSVNPDRGEPWYILGHIYQHQGKQVKAEACFKTYAQLEPESEMKELSKKAF